MSVTRVRLRTPAAAPRLYALVLCLAVASAACHDPAASSTSDEDVTAARAAALVPCDGDGQIGLVGEELTKMPTVTVTDAHGAPLPGVPVQWAISSPLMSGTVTPVARLTDERGQARAHWTLGPRDGPQTVTARAGHLAPVTFSATAAPRGMPSLFIRALPLATYDGSGQAVHPDYVATPASWSTLSDFRHWLVVTPYPANDESKENPSIFVGGGMEGWTPEPGAPAPLVKPDGGGHLSDPDMLYVPERGELWLYYRHVFAGKNSIYLTRSIDGVHWSAPVVAAAAPNHMLVSPSVVRRGPGDWLMWSVNGLAAGCAAPNAFVELRRSADGIAWSDPERVELAQPNFFPWHIDVQWIPSLNEYWAVYNVKPAGSCTTPSLYLATSPDGVQWTVQPTPVLSRGAIAEFQHVVYRSSFAYDPASDLVTLWYSGARYNGTAYVWSSAVERRRRSDLFAAIAAHPEPGRAERLTTEDDPPPLLKAP